MIHCRFAALSGCADASALPTMVLTELNTPSNFSLQSLVELFSFIRSITSGNKALYADERITLELYRQRQYNCSGQAQHL